MWIDSRRCEGVLEFDPNFVFILRKRAFREVFLGLNLSYQALFICNLAVFKPIFAYLFLLKYSYQ
jgi:hypothetical protein